MNIEFTQFHQEHVSNIFISVTFLKISQIDFFIIISALHLIQCIAELSAVWHLLYSWPAALKIEFSHYYACCLGFFPSGVPSEGPIQRPVKVNGTFLAGVNYTAPFTSANVDSLHQMIPPDLYLRENCFSSICIRLVLDGALYIHRVRH